ncbi:hypothetical protein PMAYCL1PPCAC_10356, partial [Pristionchus mayeri]
VLPNWSLELTIFSYLLRSLRSVIVEMGGPNCEKSTIIRLDPSHHFTSILRNAEFDTSKDAR